MRKKRLKKKHTPIDKSVLAIGTRRKINDPKYLASYRDLTCVSSPDGIELCGAPAIAAHIRTGEVAGIGTKPSDDITCPLCFKCHALQEANPGPEFWLEQVFKPMMRRRYKDFLTKGKFYE